MSRTSHANRGKYAENLVQRYLQKISDENFEFDFLRLPDARTSRGRGASMPGDFEFFTPNSHGILEVKSLDHTFRLPKGNVHQLPRLKKRVLAGGLVYVAVYFTRSKKWRVVKAEDLEALSGGSWDLSKYPEYDTIEEALTLDKFGLEKK